MRIYKVNVEAIVITASINFLYKTVSLHKYIQVY